MNYFSAKTKDQLSDYLKAIKKLKNPNDDNAGMLWFLTGFCIFCTATLSCLPWSILSDSELSLLVFYTLLHFLTLDTYMASYLKVSEDRKSIWIYQKFRYAPVDQKKLYHAHLYLLLHFSLKLAVVFQFLHFFFANLLAKEPFCSFATLIPVGFVALMTLIKGIEMYLHVKKEAA